MKKFKKLKERKKTKKKWLNDYWKPKKNIWKNRENKKWKKRKNIEKNHKYLIFINQRKIKGKGEKKRKKYGKNGKRTYPTTNQIYALYDVITTGHPEHPEGARDT